MSMTDGLLSMTDGLLQAVVAGAAAAVISDPVVSATAVLPIIELKSSPNRFVFQSYLLMPTLESSGEPSER